MDMFGGLTKTSSRIAIAAALGLTLGGFAFKATPAQAADLGGDCCADLEERVAELEATTVRKGNKKVSVTLSGWVVKSFNWWDDGDDNSAFVGDKGYDLGSRFAITGSATIAPGWSAGYNLTMLATADLFATAGTLANSNQFTENGNTYFDGQFNPLYSYMYIKSDTLGTLNWGHLSPASDNPAVLADISGTVIESNFVFFEGASFFLRPKGGGGSLSGLQWQDFLQCQGLGAGIGVDCWGAAMPAVRYDSPTWGGFRFETSWGKNTLTRAGADNRGTLLNSSSSQDSNFWDIALFYTADWNSIKLSAAAAYTWIETGVDTGTQTDLFQIGGSVMHKPSGLGVYAMYQAEEADGAVTTGLGLKNASLDSIGIDLPLVPLPINFTIGVNWTGGGLNAPVSQNNPSTDAWGVKPFWRKTWSPIGATVLFGEYAQYNDQFAAATNLCSAGAGLGGGALGGFCAPTAIVISPGGLAQATVTSLPGDIFKGAFVTDSEVQRWGLGVVQEIDSAAMHLWARWQHQTLDTTIVGVTVNDPVACSIAATGCATSTQRINQSWEDWDLFQVGGVIFF
jgi:hypothetical protein